jgi:DNA-directed RNA polymerase specialized sigma24 family protein
VTDSIIAKLDVEAALAKLPETERLVASLIYGAGFSQSEASRVSGIPLGSIKTYSLRVRKILIHHLDARED